VTVETCRVKDGIHLIFVVYVQTVGLNNKNLHVILFLESEFRATRCSEMQTLLKGMN
jgi:hypothetical protein